MDCTPETDSPALIYYLGVGSLFLTRNPLHWRNNGRTFVALCGLNEQSDKTTVERLFPDFQRCKRRLGL
jgi:hypothetical protein